MNGPESDLMTVRQLAAKHNMPRSRIRRAIKDGRITATLVAGSYRIDPAHFETQIQARFIVSRHDRDVISKRTEKLIITQKHTDHFSTTAAAQTLEQMLLKS